MIINQKCILSVGEVLLAACSNEKGMLKPWKPFDVAAVARQCIEAYLEASKLLISGDDILALHKRWMDAGCPTSIALSQGDRP
jgi:predicted transcriptional regulator